MGRKHKKITGFYPNIMQYTSYSFTENNILINTIDLKGKILNYVIDIENFKKYIDKIFELIVISGEITHKEICEILFKDIYKIYKTKISTKRMPFIILNLLVKEGLVYTDNGEDYILKVSEKEITEWKNSFFCN